jgi:hypothetical protein
MTDLRALAEAATPGPWARSEVPGDTLTVYQDSSGGAIAWVNGDNETGPHHPSADAAYIAAVSPDVVLALLDERDALRAALEAVITADEHDRRLVYPTYAYANLAEQARAALGPKP